MSKFFNEISTTWNELKPHLDAMESTNQSRHYHAEGNVLIHTKMVLDEFEKMIPTLDLTEHEILIINYALLLHDIAKPLCVSVDENGNIRAHGHTKLGSKLAWELLETTNLDFETRKEIVSLVRYHGKPVWIAEETTEQEHSVISLSMDCNLYYLYIVVKCDILGRISDSRDEYLEHNEYFRLLAEELDCLYLPYPFTSNIAKVKYLINKSHHCSDSPYDDTKSKVVVVCGLPGSGKDTWIKKHDSHYNVISLDEIRNELGIKPTDEQGKVIQTAKKMAKGYLAKGHDFIWNATNITTQLRRGVIELFLEYNAYVEIVYIATPFKKCLSQNKNRKEIVPEKVMYKLKNKLEIPFNIEAHEVKYVY